MELGIYSPRSPWAGPAIPSSLAFVREGCQEVGPIAPVGSRSWAMAKGRRHLSLLYHQPWWHHPPNLTHIHPPLSPLVICDSLSTGLLPSKLTGFRRQCWPPVQPLSQRERLAGIPALHATCPCCPRRKALTPQSGSLTSLHAPNVLAICNAAISDPTPPCLPSSTSSHLLFLPPECSCPFSLEKSLILQHPRK